MKLLRVRQRLLRAMFGRRRVTPGALAVSSFAFVIVACFAIVGLETWHVFVEREQRLSDIDAGITNLAQSVIQNAEDTVELADTVLVGIVQRVEAGGASPESLARLRPVLRAHVAALPRLRGVFVYDASGAWAATSLDVTPDGMNNADRAYFIYHRDNVTGGPYIGPPVRSRSGGQWVMTISRRLQHPDGSFAGVVLATVDSAYFTQWYDSMDVGEMGSIALFRRDGSLLARWPLDEEAYGKNFATSPLFSRWLREKPAGMYRTLSAIDGIGRFSAYRQGARYPLVALASLSEEESLSGWRSSAFWRLTGAILLVTLVAFLGLRMAGQARRRQRAEKIMAESEARFRLLAENSSDMVAYLDLDGVRQYVSPASKRVFGWAPEDLLGRPALDIVKAEDRPSVMASVSTLRTGESDEVTVTYRIGRPDGREVWIESILRLLRDMETKAAEGVIVVSRDISGRKAVEAELSSLAATDALTRIANRRVFDDGLAMEWRRARRERIPLSLLLIDVDHFKAFNDAYGHQAGDNCLRAVAAALTGVVQRPGDIVARYGGEEFAAILPNTDPAGALQLAERMRTGVESLGLPHDHAQGLGRVTISIGAATAMPEEDGEAAALVGKADAALYVAKRGGRNRVEVLPVAAA